MLNWPSVPISKIRKSMGDGQLPAGRDSANPVWLYRTTIAEMTSRDNTRPRFARQDLINFFS